MLAMRILRVALLKAGLLVSLSAAAQGFNLRYDGFGQGFVQGSYGLEQSGSGWVIFSGSYEPDTIAPDSILGSYRYVFTYIDEIRASVSASARVVQPVQWANEVVLEAYPNPTKGPVYIVFKTPAEIGQLDLRVVDANGRDVYRSATQAGSGIVELNTALWSNGLYVVELSSSLMEAARVKLSVQR